MKFQATFVLFILFLILTQFEKNVFENSSFNHFVRIIQISAVFFVKLSHVKKTASIGNFYISQGIQKVMSIFGTRGHSNFSLPLHFRYLIVEFAFLFAKEIN